jgi:uncharacterized protein DUF4012
VGELVLLLSNDPSLGGTLESLARGRMRVAGIDPARRPAAWPWPSAATVVLDLTRKDRDAAYPWVRQHHTGRVVVLLKPGEREASLPPDPDRLVIQRPFRLIDLIEILAGPDASAGPTAMPADGRSSAARVSQSPGRRGSLGREPTGRATAGPPAAAALPTRPTLSTAAPPAGTETPGRPAASAGEAAVRAGEPQQQEPSAVEPDVPAANPKETARRAPGWETTTAELEAARRAREQRRAARAAKTASRAGKAEVWPPIRPVPAPGSATRPSPTSKAAAVPEDLPSLSGPAPAAEVAPGPSVEAPPTTAAPASRAKAPAAGEAPAAGGLAAGVAEAPTAPPEVPTGRADAPTDPSQTPPRPSSAGTAARPQLPGSPPQGPAGSTRSPGGTAAAAAARSVPHGLKEGARRAAEWGATKATRETTPQAAVERPAARVTTRAPEAPIPPVGRGPAEPRRPGPSAGRRQRLSPARAVLVGALAVLAVAGGWLGLGLLKAREDLRSSASGYRNELAKAEAALRRGDPAAARAAIGAASRNLDGAEAVTARRPMRVAAHLPLLSSGVSDANHLLAAARNLTAAGDRGIAVSTHLQSGRFAVLERGRFDLAALEDAIRQAKGLVVELDQVRQELAQVRGGPLAPGSDETKRWALGRLDEAVSRAQPVVSTLETLPAALGADAPRTYLVALTTPAELRPGGGVPLAVFQVGLDRGVVEVRARDGAIAENVHNAQATWPAVPGDPWARGGRFTQFSLANSSPDFPTAGQELLRAYAARGRAKPDGVIAIDTLAMRAVLEASGPVTVAGYGRLTAANCVQRTTHDAYLRWPDRTERRRFNDALLDALLARLLSGRDLVTTGKVLGAAGGRRQMQVYLADPNLAKALAENGMGGTLSPPGTDYLGVYTLNRNRSRMDYFQRRGIHHLVKLRSDRSAEVTRTVTVVNDVPRGEPIQDGARDGYSSGRATAVLANYLPPGAKVEEATLDSRPVRWSEVREAGRPLVRVDVDLAPGQSAEFAIRYLTPKGVATKDGFLYRFTADPQAMVRPPDLRVDVVAPPGMLIVPPAGWAVDGPQATLRQPLVEPIDATLDLRG